MVLLGAFLLPVRFNIDVYSGTCLLQRVPNENLKPRSQYHILAAKNRNRRDLLSESQNIFAEEDDIQVLELRKDWEGAGYMRMVRTMGQKQSRQHKGHCSMY